MERNKKEDPVKIQNLVLKSFISTSVISFLVLGGCAKKPAAPPPPPPPPPVSIPAPKPALPVPLNTAASITGKVVSAKAHGKGLSQILVFVEKGVSPKIKFHAPSIPVTLNIVKDMYQPAIFGVMTGQPINVVNHDKKVSHKVEFLSKPKQTFTIQGIKPGSPTPSKQVVFTKSGIIPIKCGTHPMMSALVGVFSNPYFAVTNKKGEFSLTDLPPGTLILEAVQQNGSKTIMKVKVGKKQTKKIILKFKG